LSVTLRSGIRYGYARNPPRRYSAGPAGSSWRFAGHRRHGGGYCPSVESGGRSGGGAGLRDRADVFLTAGRSSRARRLLSLSTTNERGSSVRRSVRVRAARQVNLGLRVPQTGRMDSTSSGPVFNHFARRPLEASYTPAVPRGAAHDAGNIPNKPGRTRARMAMEAMGATGRVEIRLEKRIPMGGAWAAARRMQRRFCWLCRLSPAAPSISGRSPIGVKPGQRRPFFLIAGLP